MPATNISPAVVKGCLLLRETKSDKTIVIQAKFSGYISEKKPE